jgi:hypothetical protein
MVIKTNELGRCPICGRIHDIDKLERVPEDEVIGCGLTNGKLIFCDDCIREYDDEDCKQIRTMRKLSVTTAGEFCNMKQSEP